MKKNKYRVSITNVLVQIYVEAESEDKACETAVDNWHSKTSDVILTDWSDREAELLDEDDGPMEHTERCMCPVCHSPEKSLYPLILFDGYQTDTFDVKMAGVFWNGERWFVEYDLKNIGADPDTSVRTNCSSLNWNVDCQSWRKDLCPKGIAGRGWRRGEKNG